MYNINFKKTYFNDKDFDMIISIDATTSNSKISVVNKSSTDVKSIMINAKSLSSGELNQMRVRKGDEVVIEFPAHQNPLLMSGTLRTVAGTIEFSDYTE